MDTFHHLITVVLTFQKLKQYISTGNISEILQEAPHSVIRVSKDFRCSLRRCAKKGFEMREKADLSYLRHFGPVFSVLTQ